MIKMKDFIKRISKETGYAQKDISAVLEAAESIMVDAVKNGDGVKIFKSLGIEPMIRKGHVGVNPSTREPIIIPDKRFPKAKFSQAFKDILNI